MRENYFKLNSVYLAACCGHSPLGVSKGGEWNYPPFVARANSLRAERNQLGKTTLPQVAG